MEWVRAALKSQYRAALAMLRDAIQKCPDDLWTSDAYLNPFWRVAYHALFYTHLYMQTDEFAFTPWEHHRLGIQHMDDILPEPMFESSMEPPEAPSVAASPYSREEVLAYWDICNSMVDGAVDGFDLEATDSGFSWYTMSKLEHQLVNIRHIQHHAAQLGDRVRSAIDVGIGWVGARR